MQDEQEKTILKGTVADERGRPLENVLVRILNSNYEASTNEEGIFALELPPGVYLLEAEKRGFASLSRYLEIGNSGASLKIILPLALQSLDEVVVTAQKREELLKDIPISITSLSAQDIKESRIWSTGDLSASAPNLYTSNPGDRRNVTSLRGIVSSSYDPAVATYIDGVNQFNLDTYIAQLFDVQRIEILRGPQGPLYGRNAMGGAINIITRQPTNRRSLFAETSLANYNTQRFTAGVRTPILKDKLFFGAAGLYEHTGGFYDNQFNNSNYDQKHSYSGNYYFKYSLNPFWNIDLNFKHIANRNYGAFPLVMGIEEALENPYSLNQNQVSEMVDNTLNASLSLEYNGKRLNFRSQSSYQSNHRYYREALDGDFSPLDAISIYNNYGKDWNGVEVVTQEFRFSSPADLEHRLKWNSGVYLFYQRNAVKQATIFGEDAAVMGLEDTNFELVTTTEGTGVGAAVFGQGTYSLTSDLELTLGLRYDHEKKKQSVQGEYHRNSAPATSFEFQKDTVGKAHFTAFSPKLGLSYELSEDHSAYFTYSQGFRAGGLTSLSTDPSMPPLHEFKPEFSHNYELGSKNFFLDKKLMLNLSLFYTEVRNVQVPRLLLPEALTIIRNTGKLSSRGAELELSSLPLRNLELLWNFGTTDARYNSLKIAAQGDEQDLGRKKQIFTPEITSFLALQYKLEFGRKGLRQMFIRGEWKAFGEQYFDLANTLRQEPYQLFGAHIGVAYRSMEFTLWARNLFDERYISYAYDFGAVHLGDPRMLGVTVGVEL